MKISDIQLDGFQLNYPLEKLAPPESVLFIDIETTGFIARSSQLYLIGCAYYREKTWHILQWFAEQKAEEAEILSAFTDFSEKYSHLIHFNGNQFDLPYLKQKCEQYKLNCNFDKFQGIDIYKRISPYKNFLRLTNCKQKTVEQFLGIQRKDIFSGGELISVYREYLSNPSDPLLHVLLLHNFDDVKGMLNCLPVLKYCDLFHTPLSVSGVCTGQYTDYQGNLQKELLIQIALEQPLPVPLSTHANNCFFTSDRDKCTIKVPIYEGELKYFYANYKDYYYLPAEDLALHKAVAGYVDKAHRIQAKAATCYTKRISSYLPQWDSVFEPSFKKEFKSPELFFELTGELEKDHDAFSRYATHILNKMAM